jgi:glutathione synthase
MIRAMGLQLVFIMDPIERINIETDSTFVLMLEAEARGHAAYYAQIQDLELSGGEPFALARRAVVRRKRGDHHELGPVERIALSSADAVFMRKDPPIDVGYFLATLVLDRVDARRVVMVNDPQALRDYNEKLAALYFPELTPRTIVTANRARLTEFVHEVGQAVLKPLSFSGGAGVLRVGIGDLNLGSAIDLLTQEGRVMIEAQAFIEAFGDGDKRIILLDGAPIGAVNRRPRPGDIRANLHVGGVAERTVLSDRDRQICAAIGPELSRRGLVFVGIDVVGGFLTEINVTSPTGLQEANRLDGLKLEADILDWVEARRDVLSSA